MEDQPASRHAFRSQHVRLIYQSLLGRQSEHIVRDVTATLLPIPPPQNCRVQKSLSAIVLGNTAIPLKQLIISEEVSK